MITFYIGLDLGQKRDPAAIAVVERRRLAYQPSGSLTLMVRHLERGPLGTPYPGIAWSSGGRYAAHRPPRLRDFRPPRTRRIENRAQLTGSRRHGVRADGYAVFKQR